MAYRRYSWLGRLWRHHLAHLYVDHKPRISLGVRIGWFLLPAGIFVIRLRFRNILSGIPSVEFVAQGGAVRACRTTDGRIAIRIQCCTAARCAGRKRANSSINIISIARRMAGDDVGIGRLSLKAGGLSAGNSLSLERRTLNRVKRLPLGDSK